MSTFRTLFLGTPDIAAHCLQSLIDDDHFELVGVVTQPDRPAGRKLKLTPSPVKQLALENGLPVFSPESVNTDEMLETLKDLKAECAVVVAFGQLMKQPFLDLYPRKIVNVHASLLPLWRGAAPIQRSIMAGDKETGCALQVMELALDAGDVIGQRKISVNDEWSALDLLEQMKGLASDLLCQDFLDYLRGMLSPVAQDESKVTYAHKLTKEEARIDWSRTASEIFNHIRGYQMGPGAFTEVDGKKLKLHRSKVADESAKGTPGQYEIVDGSRLLVACGADTVLELLLVQPANKGRMDVGDFLRGRSLPDGGVFQ